MYTRAVFSALVFSLFSISGPSSAEDGVDAWAGTEEIVVTGDETPTLLDIGKGDSTVAFDTKRLDAIGADDIGDLAAYTPNLEIKTAGGASQPIIFIRGVGLADFSAISSGSIAIYQDDVPINSPAIQLGTLFDTEAVKIIRGPEGGTSSRNASGGAIKVDSRKPRGELGGYVRATYGNYNHRDVEGAVELPILEDLLSMRVAFRVTERDGWTRNGCGNAPPAAERIVRGAGPNLSQICGDDVPAQGISDILPGGERDVNDAGNWAMRGLFRSQDAFDGGEMDWLLNVHGGRRNQLSGLGQTFGTAGIVPEAATGELMPPGAVIGRLGGFSGSGPYRDRDVTILEDKLAAKYPNSLFSSFPKPGRAKQAFIFPLLAERLAKNLDQDPFRGDYGRTGRERVDSWGASLKAVISFDNGLEITSVTGFERYERTRLTDNDSTPDVLFESYQKDDAWQASQELLATRTFNDVFVLYLGGLVLREELDAHIDNFRFTQSFDRLIIDAPVIDRTREYTQKTWNAGAFVRFEWELQESLTVDAGIRYNFEKKNFNYALLGELQDRRILTSNDWDAPTYHVRLLHDATENLHFYMKFTRGWRAGHFNATSNTLVSVKPAAPESVNSWEVGLAGGWYDDSFRLKLTGFYYRYEDLQVFVTNRDLGSVPEQVIVNADDAQIYGIELEVVAQPVENLRLLLNYGWLETEYLDFVDEVLVQETVSLTPPPAVFLNRKLNEDFSGNRLANTPRHKISLSAEYDWNLGRLGFLTPSYFSTWTDDVGFDQTNGVGFTNDSGQRFLPKYAIGQKAYWVHNMRLGYRTEDQQIELALWVRNMTNEVYKTFAFNARDFIVNFVGAPRTYGGDLIFRW